MARIKLRLDAREWEAEEPKVGQFDLRRAHSLAKLALEYGDKLAAFEKQVLESTEESLPALLEQRYGNEIVLEKLADELVRRILRYLDFACAPLAECVRAQEKDAAIVSALAIFNQLFETLVGSGARIKN